MNLEQLIAGALLKFNGELDNIDLIILNKLINVDIKGESFKIIDKYFNIENNKIFFKEGIDFDTLDYAIKIKDVLNFIQGEYFKNFYNNLDLKEFVLRKVKYLEHIRKENINDTFNKKEYNTFLELLQAGLLMIPWIQDGTIYGDYEALTLSKEGEVYLYIKDNQEQINLFKNELLVNGYNPDFLFMYLENKDLNKNYEEIFNIDNYKIFGNIYNLDISLNSLKR